MSRTQMKPPRPGAGGSLIPRPGHLPAPEPLFEGESPPTTDQPGDLTSAEVIDAREFEVNFGEPLDRTLDLDTWDDGKDLDAIFAKLDEEVSRALAQEDELRKQVRKVLFPMIGKRPNAPKGAGVFRATRKQLQDTQVNVLFK